MMKFLRKIRRFLFPQKSYEIQFPSCGELSDEERAWLFGEELNDK